MTSSFVFDMINTFNNNPAILYEMAGLLYKLCRLFVQLETAQLNFNSILASATCKINLPFLLVAPEFYRQEVNSLMLFHLKSPNDLSVPPTSS